MELTILDAAQVRSALPMADCIGAMERAMRAASDGKVSMPPRLITPLVNGKGWLGLMPGSTASPPVYGAKVVGLHPDNPRHGRPTIQGFVMLFDLDTGQPLAILDGATVTAVRTAAASGLATRELARPDARTHGVFGTGVQARAHLEAVAAVRDIRQAVVWGRDPAKAARLVQECAQAFGFELRATAKAEEAAGCDIVSTVTGSPEPVLRGAWVQPGAHVNLVGAHTPKTREADDELVRKSTVYVDLMESARNEAGDLLIPIANGSFREADIAGEIGAVLLKRKPGRRDARAITLYKSLGIVAQDLYAAEQALRSAAARGLGTRVRM